MDSEQYEILPHEELEALRKEVEFLKQNPLGETKQADGLKASIDQLTESIHALMNLLSNVNKDMTADYENMTVESHFSHLSQQNQTIAQGILSVAELVKKHHKEDKETLQKKFEEESMNNVPTVNSTNPQMANMQMQGNYTQQGMQNGAPVSSMNPGLAQNNIPQPTRNQQTQNQNMPPPPGNNIPPPPLQNQQKPQNKKGGLFRFK